MSLAAVRADRDDGDESERIKSSAELRLRRDVLAVPVTPRSNEPTPRSHASPKVAEDAGSPSKCENQENKDGANESPAAARIREKEKELEEHRKRVLHLQQQQEQQEARVRQLQEEKENSQRQQQEAKMQQGKPSTDETATTKSDDTSAALAASPGKNKKSRNRKKAKNLVKPGDLVPQPADAAGDAADELPSPPATTEAPTPTTEAGDAHGDAADTSERALLESPERAHSDMPARTPQGDCGDGGVGGAPYAQEAAQEHEAAAEAEGRGELTLEARGQEQAEGGEEDAAAAHEVRGPQGASKEDSAMQVASPPAAATPPAASATADAGARLPGELEETARTLFLANLDQRAQSSKASDDSYQQPAPPAPLPSAQDAHTGGAEDLPKVQSALSREQVAHAHDGERPAALVEEAEGAEQRRQEHEAAAGPAGPALAGAGASSGADVAKEDQNGAKEEGRGVEEGKTAEEAGPEPKAQDAEEAKPGKGRRNLRLVAPPDATPLATAAGAAAGAAVAAPKKVAGAASSDGKKSGDSSGKAVRAATGGARDTAKGREGAGATTKGVPVPKLDAHGARDAGGGSRGGGGGSLLSSTAAFKGRAERVAASRNKLKDLSLKRSSLPADTSAAARDAVRDRVPPAPAAGGSPPPFDLSISPPPDARKSPDAASAAPPPKLVVNKAREAEIVERLSDSAVKKHQECLRQIQEREEERARHSNSQWQVRLVGVNERCGCRGEYACMCMCVHVKQPVAGWASGNG